MYNEMCMTSGLIIDSLTQSIFHCMWERSNEEEKEDKMPRNKTKTYWMSGGISKFQAYLDLYYCSLKYFLFRNILK